MHHRSQAATLLSFLAVLALAGCASTEIRPRRSVYGALTLPADVGAIGLTVARPVPEFALQLPVDKGSAARATSGTGARDMLRDPVAAPYFPLGFVLGGLIGGVLGVSESELKTATPSIQAAAQQFHFDKRIAKAVRDSIGASHARPVHELADNLPTEPAPVPGRLRRESGRRLTWSRAAPAPHPLAGTGIDTLISIRVAFQGFQVRPNPNVRSTGDLELINPPLALTLTVDISALRVRDWVPLGGLTLSYESLPSKFTEWAAGDATALRREGEQALQEILREVTLHLGSGRQHSSAHD
jgi:hypothetical protein